MTKQAGPLSVKQPIMLFVRLLGRRAFWSFFLVTFLIVGVLAATNIVSKYAIKSYTEDQLRQLKWDTVLYQSRDLSRFPEISERVSKSSGVTRTESFGLLRVRLTSQMPIEVDGTPVFVPWLSIISATDPSTLPPELRSEGGILLAMLGPQKVIKPYLDHISKGSKLSIKVGTPRLGLDQSHLDQSTVSANTEVFSGQLSAVTQLDRLEMVKWVMREIGSATFIPELGIIIVLPMDQFKQEIAHLDLIMRQQDYGIGRDEGSASELGVTYTPEIDHLISLDRDRLFSGWDLEQSRNNVSGVLDQIRTVSQDIDFNIVTNSDLYMTLDKLVATSRLVGLVSILISIPILWMAWTFAGTLANLVVLNERRLIGLLRMRGASSIQIGRAFTVAIVSGSLGGGIAGVIVGTAAPLLGYHFFSGTSIPISLIHKIQEPWSLGLFIVVATMIGLLAGKKVTDRVARMTPREAAARVSSSEARAFVFRFSTLQLISLLLGTYKIGAWIADYAPSTAYLREADQLLSFIAVPLFIYGFVSLMISRSALTERVLRKLAAPFAGDLQWFAVRNMMMRPHRVLSAILIAAMMFSISLYPKVTSDSFYDKTTRAVKQNTGADLALFFEATQMTDGEIRAESIGDNLKRMDPKASALVSQVKNVEGVASTAELFEFTMSGSFYLPGHSSVPLYVLRDRRNYLDVVYYERELGSEKPFNQTLEQLPQGVVISSGLVNVTGIAPGDRLSLGRGASGEKVKDTVSGVVSVLPGAPDLMLQNREAYLGADIEFINYIGRTNSFAVGDSQRLQNLEALPSRFVVLVNAANGADVDAIKRKIEGLNLPAKIGYIKSRVEETQKLSKDMFVSLALQNLAVYMIGGILVAFAGILSISVANFIEARRTFALLRMRGCSPRWLLRLLVSDFFVPVLCGMVFGIFVGILAGYGMTSQLFRIPRVLSALELLPVHLVVSPAVFVIIGVLISFFAAAAVSFSFWIFRRTARETLSAG